MKSPAKRPLIGFGLSQSVSRGSFRRCITERVKVGQWLSSTIKPPDALPKNLRTRNTTICRGVLSAPSWLTLFLRLPRCRSSLSPRDLKFLGSPRDRCFDALALVSEIVPPSASAAEKSGGKSTFTARTARKQSVFSRKTEFLSTKGA